MWRPAIGLRALRQHWAMSTCVEQCCRTVDSLARAGHLVRYAQNWAHGCSGENLAVHGRRWTVRAGPGCTMRLPGRTRHRRTTPRSMAAPDARKGCGARVVTGWLRGRNEVVTGRQTTEASSEIRAGPFCLSMRSLPVLLTLLAAPANAVSNIPRPPAVPPPLANPDGHLTRAGSEDVLLDRRLRPPWPLEGCVNESRAEGPEFAQGPERR